MGNYATEGYSGDFESDLAEAQTQQEFYDTIRHYSATSDAGNT